jgi:RimJ/RimL family protein N-acetyltransferase
MKQPVLETDRLILRSFVEDDAVRISELAGDRAVSDTTLRIPHPYSVEMAIEWIGTHQRLRDRDKALFYAIDLKDSGLFIGSTGLDLDLAHGRAEIGYWIGKEYWSRGYATEASMRLLEFAFTELKLHKVTAHHFERNTVSGHILEKMGMIKEGLLRSHIRNAGEWEDIVEYGILEREYRKLASGLQRSG